MSSAMITARVDSERKREAERVLKKHGRTYSDLIRDLTDYLARTGELPLFERQTLELIENEEKRRRIAQLEAFANRPVPPVLDDRSDEALLAESRDERFSRFEA
ncbi:type II toxin-antitoxin system RelB/DinJ family antitoxin [Bifidobacterium canis]|uniref:RelB antitoxin n=1 Tax=Bifidobacterium canis TaxID=2610880 RepID=A0A7K1J568_9BIFI|nr:type II toxin-antitoxin system RelB/DinJ family antitoxin [Bifidobacterium canis]MUH59803.1 RelB antitoxin [Bifidobacterium canis]